MAKTTVTERSEVTTLAEVAKNTDTFEFTLHNGEVIVCGKPRGVLKLRLRNVLDAELLKDPEIVAIATALLCVRTIGGQPQMIHTNGTFQSMLGRFESDDEIDRFMNEYQRFSNPEVAKAIEEVMDLALKGEIAPTEVQDKIAERIMQIELDKRERVKH